MTRILVGFVSAVALSILSVSTTGIAGATAFVLAHFAAALTAAFAVAATIDRLAGSGLREVANRDFTGHCHECGRPLLQVSWVWFCSVCDRAPAVHLPYVGRRH